MKGFVLSAALTLLPITGSADVGIGAALDPFEDILFVPIELGAATRVEPFIAWTEYDISGGESYDALTLGVGIFRKINAPDRVQAYFGGRLGYTEFESDTPTFDQQSHGYLLEPTLGIEYHFVEQVSVSVEAVAYYHWSDEEAGGNAFDRKGAGTSSRIVLRAYFPH